MAWIDDRIWCHSKFVDLSAHAFRLYVHGLAYSTGFNCRGVLTAGQQKTIGASTATRRELVAAGLWDETVGDLRVSIHDWDEHNGKRDARREADRERKRRIRSAGQSAGQSAGASTVAARVDGSDGKTKPKSRPSSPSAPSLALVKTSGDLEPQTAPWRLVYDHWRQARGKTRSSYDRPSPKRTKAIVARLAHFTVDDLCKAIDGVACDTWAERPQHDDLLQIFRTDEQVEKFLELEARRPGQNRGFVTAADLLNEAMQEVSDDRAAS